MLVIASDTHFSPYGAWRGRGIVGDDEHAFDQVVEFCCAPGRVVDGLILAGDVFESKDLLDARTPGLQRRLFDRVDRLEEKSVGLTYVLGQHDLGIDWLSLHGMAQNGHGRLYDFGRNFPLAQALSYTPRDELPGRLAAIPEDVRLLICHQSWSELMGCARAGADASLAELASSTRVDVVLTGDYHKAVEAFVDRPDGSTLWAFSPGPVSLQAIDEDPEKSFLLVDVDGEGSVVFDRVPLTGRAVLSYTLAAHDADSDELLAVMASEVDEALGDRRLPDALRRPIVRLRLHREPAGFLAEVRRQCAGRAHLFESLEPGAEESGSIVSVGWSAAAGVTLADVLQETCGDPAVASLAVELVGGPRPAEVLRGRLAAAEGGVEVPCD